MQLEDWDTARWEAVPRPMFVKFRTFLLVNDVLVPVDRGNIAANIERTAKQEEYRTWSTEDIQAYAKRSTR